MVSEMWFKATRTAYLVGALTLGGVVGGAVGNFNGYLSGKAEGQSRIERLTDENRNLNFTCKGLENQVGQYEVNATNSENQEYFISNGNLGCKSSGKVNPLETVRGFAMPTGVSNVAAYTWLKSHYSTDDMTAGKKVYDLEEAAEEAAAEAGKEAAYKNR
jgi:hypothetical protein